MKKGIQDFIKQNYIYIIFCIVFIIVNCLYLITTGEELSNIQKTLILIGLLVLSIICYIVLYFFEKKNVKIEKRYLIISLIIGIIFLFTIPLSIVPDEYNHFLRAYEISEGYLISNQNLDTNQVGRELPNNLNIVEQNKYSDFFESFSEKESDETKFLAFPNTALYSAICYIPQVIGILCGKILDLPILIQAYLGRIANFTFYLSITYLALKYIPSKKYLCAFLLLLPISIQEAISLSPDTLTNAVAFALVAFILYVKYSSEKCMTKKDYIIMASLAIVLSMCKIVYLPMCLLLFLIPKERFKTQKSKIIFIVGLLFTVVIMNLLWTKTVYKFLDVKLNDSNPGEQLEFILNNPIEYIKVLFNTVGNIDFYISTFIGSRLGLLDIYTYYPYICISKIILCIYILGNTEEEFDIDNKSKLLMIFSFLLVVLLICTALYIQWTALQSTRVEGIQGRYFIPISLILGYICYNKKIKIDKNLFNKFVMSFIISENIMCILAFILKFI